MRINADKCFSLRLSTTKTDRAPLVIKEPSYKIDGNWVDATKYDNFLKYLGIKFNPHGKMKPNISQLVTMLDRVKRSPLKPYQKLELLRNNVIPNFLHEMVLGRVTKGLLITYDKKIKGFVGGVLDLPHDIPISFYYSKVKEGGLGLPSLEFSIPRSLFRRIEKMIDSNDPIITSLYEHELMGNVRKKCVNITGMNDIASALASTNRSKFKN